MKGHVTDSHTMCKQFTKYLFDTIETDFKVWPNEITVFCHPDNQELTKVVGQQFLFWSSSSLQNTNNAEKFDSISVQLPCIPELYYLHVTEKLI